MKKLFVLVLLSGTLNAFSQDWPIKKMVTAKRESGVQFTILPVFTFVASKTVAGQGIYQQLQLDPSFLSRVTKERPAALQLSLPLDNNKSLSCELVKFSLGNIQVTENNEQTIENLKVPVTYRGIIAGIKEKNMVILTVNEEYVSLVADIPGAAIQVTKTDETNNKVYHLYNSASIKFPAAVPLDCGTKTDESSQASKTANGIDLTGIQVNPLAAQDKCVNVFVDCFDSMYMWQKSSPQQVVYYVYELFNLVAGGYLNEQINIQVTTINIWKTADPYRGDTRKNSLTDLGAQWKDNFWGNLCVGLDFSLKTPAGNGKSGIAGDIARVKGVAVNTCPVYDAVNNKSACCYNDLNYGGSYSSFPTGPSTTQAQVYLVMHEMGHLLGSRHTHWCGWKLSSNPDVFGVIDSCGPQEDGPCAKGPSPPGGAGTIMSYCNYSGGLQINYYNGFGTLPGNAIRNFVDQNACILTCVECFGARNNSNKELYAFQNTSAVLKKESGTGKNNSSEPPQKQPAAGNLLINAQKIKQ